MVKRLSVAASLVAAGAAAFALTALTSNGTTIGQTATSPISCVSNIAALQTGVHSGASFTVPGGTWETTSWTTIAGSQVGPMAAAMFRPTGANTYSVVAISPTVTPAPNQVNTFPWSTTVEGGDILGFWLGSGTNDCANEAGNAGDTFGLAGAATKPAPGDTITPAPGNIIILDISASLVSPGGSEVTVDHVYVCYSKFEQDGGEVQDPATGAALVSAGRWYPTALPGNVDGGENVGAYHLSCNPPAPVTPTGQYVGIGGAVTSEPSAGAYAIAG